VESLLQFAPFALEGQWFGAAAVALVLVGIFIFIGTIYILLVSIYGWLQAYLVTMVSLMIFSIILSAVWLFGIPGTIPGTGPRGTEPHWVVFLADSEQGLEFDEEIAAFPADRSVQAPDAGSFGSGEWRVPNANEQYPGQINVEGELDGLKSVLLPALAGYFQQQETGSANPSDYQFRLEGREPTPDQAALPVARVAFHPNGDVRTIDSGTQEVLETDDVGDPSDRLLAGIDIPATANHPAIRVFAYRNKGQVFMASAQWMIISVILFVVHLWWLARFENKQKRREAELAAGTSPREPVATG